LDVAASLFPQSLRPLVRLEPQQALESSSAEEAQAGRQTRETPGGSGRDGMTGSPRLALGDAVSAEPTGRAKVALGGQRPAVP